ncbi:MAG: hypothetical protein OEL78_02100 [Hyphomicrobiales bacterium]|jgi:hypothetical protein|nr:hypothetical protein [Hyphomicrobiales bacterium]
MKLFSRLFGRPVGNVNSVTYWERQRLAHSMLGETAAVAAARLGCIAG